MIFSQNSDVDSLKLMVQNESNDSIKVNLLIKIALKSEPSIALEYLNEASELVNYDNCSVLSRINYLKGRLFYFTKEFDSSLNSFKDAVKYYSKCNKKEDIANCYFNIADILAYQKGQIDSSIVYGLKSYAIRDSLNLILPKIEMSTRLAEYYARVGLMNDSEKHITISQQLLIGLNDTLELMDFYSSCVFIYGQQYAVESAVEYANKSIEFRKILNDSIGLAKDYINLGNTLILFNKYDSASSYFQLAYSIYDDINLNIGKCRSLVGMASIASHLKQFRESNDLYFRAISIYENIEKEEGLNVSSGFASTYFGIGANYIKSDSLEFEKGIIFLNKADSCFLEVNNIKGSIEVNQQIALGYYKKEEYYKVIGILTRFNLLKRSINSGSLSSIGYMSLGASYLKIEDFVNAEKYLLMADSLSSKSKIPKQKIEVYNNLYTLYKRTDKLEKALNCSDSLLMWNSNLYDKERQELVVKYQKEFMVSETKRKFEEEINKSYKDRSLLIYTIFTFLTIGIILFLQNFKVRQKNKELNLEVDKIVLRNEESTQYIEKLITEDKVFEDEVSLEIIENPVKLKSDNDDKIREVLNTEIEFTENYPYQYKDFIYFERSKNNIHFYTTDGKKHLNGKGALRKLNIEVFKEPIFFLVHKTYLINAFNVSKINPHSGIIVMNDSNNKEIKIANKRKVEMTKKIEKAFIKKEKMEDKLNRSQH